MKYFCEAETNYRIICAGSLLGVKLKRFGSSFPVGKITIRTLYPMDFEEFLLACNETDLRNLIRESFAQSRPMPESLHRKALELYRMYLLVGGMPRLVRDFIENGKDILRLDQELYSTLLTSYFADMTKYVESAAESMKIAQTFSSVPRQLAKENPKFMYKEIRKNANKRDFQSAIDWLSASGLILRVHDAASPASPLKGYEDESRFKIYLSDPGLLANLCRLRYSDLIAGERNLYKASVVENYVVCQLAS